MTKKCNSCGLENPDNADFCLNCGAPLNPGSNPVPSVPAPSKGSKFPKKAVFAVGIIAVLLIAILIIIFPYFSSTGYVTTSDMSSVFGGSWREIPSFSAKLTFSNNVAEINYFNGTIQKVNLNSSDNYFICDGAKYLYQDNIQKIYEIDMNNSAGYHVIEIVRVATIGSPYYDKLKSNVSVLFLSFGLQNVSHNGDVYYAYVYTFYGNELIFNLHTGYIVLLQGLPSIDQATAAKLASYVS
ncbi:zinc ribbon domain-containing protein [Sulfuracidifex metallicus]|uniref:zinc ribbon domain-containing protein n=1 Tax=Sulfuracidifex metallicus TaxID=47303 RepID=UPI0022727563|nr:zinc ribbon domain-containing protein [Sulfuracidifex metallicus]MCY0849679.1 zinc ribbon domain-containing protein [Sulfuracidifex metallicus]